jgi:hypothetical protein
LDGFQPKDFDLTFEDYIKNKLGDTQYEIKVDKTGNKVVDVYESGYNVHYGTGKKDMVLDDSNRLVAYSSENAWKEFMYNPKYKNWAAGKITGGEDLLLLSDWVDMLQASDYAATDDGKSKLYDFEEAIANGEVGFDIAETIQNLVDQYGNLTIDNIEKNLSLKADTLFKTQT